MKRQEIIDKLLKKGYSNATAIYYGNKIYDELNSTKYSDVEIKWAYEHGFLAEEVRTLGITEENQNEFIRSKDYHFLDPIDPLTKRLVDGKLVLPYTIGGRFPEYIPKYFAWIKDENTICRMNDNPVETYENVVDYIEKIIEIEGTVAIKPYTGAGGIGFVKLEKKDGSYFVNNNICNSIETLIPQISNNYLITEYVKQCKEFDEVWPDSVATLRIITINREANGEEPLSFISFVRFGTKQSKGASNLASGGVGVPFSMETGEYYPVFYRYIDYCPDGKYIMSTHPDSGVSLKGKKLPHFDEVKALVSNVCKFLPVYSYFGFDIMITDSGVKMCEINSHPSLDYAQKMFGGLWTQCNEVKKFFEEKINKKGIPTISLMDFQK